MLWRVPEVESGNILFAENNRFFDPYDRNRGYGRKFVPKPEGVA